MLKRIASMTSRALPSRLALVQQITRRVAPPVCVLCGAPGQPGGEPWGLDLCSPCEAACQRPDGHTGTSASDDVPVGIDSLQVLFLYRPPVDRLVTQLKFGLDPAPARVLAMLFASELLALQEEEIHEPAPQCIVPVPLHPLRLRERGFNQCAEIARHLAPRIQVPVEARLLQRLRHARAQSELTAAERRVNVLDAFGIDLRRNIPRHVALLDDVMTTGSTLAAAAGALKSAGVQRVDAWVIARAIRGDSRINPGGQDPSSAAA